ncbi:uncharacterized protein EI90DRAFT_3027649 [Cantharellus anzutake]|uniref:uncharacterized protein n=1 Tax=Cantharellus anzutake TaxID=1750568 RepID=UPI0019063E18|nr:uncharacterized protein EI90DRAFT_3027649 [Cantharellus anzutake]KAF8343948.1 hypothetical protein EI90DRAFT_3027649 [Cantharellus anzutake]
MLMNSAKKIPPKQASYLHVISDSPHVYYNQLSRLGHVPVHVGQSRNTITITKMPFSTHGGPKVGPGGMERMRMSDPLDYTQGVRDQKYALKRGGPLPDGLVGWDGDKLQSLFDSIWGLEGWALVRAELPRFDSPPSIDPQRKREELKRLAEGLKEMFAAAKTLARAHNVI